MDENEQFYLEKSIAGLKLNQSAQNPITYLYPKAVTEEKLERE